MKKLVCIIALGAFLTVEAQQETPIIYPGSDQLDVSIFKDFDVEYDQGGFSMNVRFVRSGEDKPIYTAFMTMPNPLNPGELNVDIIGHYADDFNFAYRKFGYGRFGSEFIHAQNINDSLHVSRMPLPATNQKASYSLLTPGEKFVDGTFAFWLLAGLPLERGYRARFYRWDVKEKEIGFLETLVFKVADESKSIESAGKIYHCWPVDVKLPNGMTLRSYVSKDAPYLIKQEGLMDNGDVMPFVTLKSVN